MAPFAFDLLDEEERKKSEEESGGGAAPAMTGGGETFSGGSESSQGFNAAPSQKGTTKQGSGFVGLDKYIGANRGNQFGQQFTGKVQNTVDSAKQSLEQSANDFTQASNQSATKWNDVQDSVKSVVDNAGDNTSQDDVSRIRGLASAQYKGPESFLGSAYGAQAQGNIQKASQQANAMQTEGGRFALLDQYFGRPKYNMGEKSLDNLLVQSAPGVAAKSSRIGNQAKQLATQANQTTQDLDNLARSNMAATQEAAKKTNDYLTGAKSQFESDLQGRFANYKAENDAYNQARRADLGDDALDEETMRLLGLQDGASLFDLNLSNYLQDASQSTLGEFASDRDYAKYIALSQLAGVNPSLLNSDNRAKAGTAKGKVEFDKSRINKDLTERSSAFESQAAPIRQQIDQANNRYQQLQMVLNSYKGPIYAGQTIDGDALLNPDYEAIVKVVENAKQELANLQNQYSRLESAYGSNRKLKPAAAQISRGIRGEIGPR